MRVIQHFCASRNNGHSLFYSNEVQLEYCFSSSLPARVLTAAHQADQEGASEIAAFEFGVDRGDELLCLEKYAAMVERETGVRIAAYGFDTGKGIPLMSGDYRDHPDQWRVGNYLMDEKLLRKRLSGRTTLLIGNVAQTVLEFVRNIRSHAGFVALDLDLYLSAMDALRIFLLARRKMLRRVPMYFDNIDFFFNHKFAGELLAIDQFNLTNKQVKIDRWRVIAKRRVFPESPRLSKMFVAHDLAAISKVALGRLPTSLI